MKRDFEAEQRIRLQFFALIWIVLMWSGHAPTGMRWSDMTHQPSITLRHTPQHTCALTTDRDLVMTTFSLVGSKGNEAYKCNLQQEVRQLEQEADACCARRQWEHSFFLEVNQALEDQGEILITDVTFRSMQAR